MARGLLAETSRRTARPTLPHGCARLTCECAYPKEEAHSTSDVVNLRLVEIAHEREQTRFGRTQRSALLRSRGSKKVVDGDIEDAREAACKVEGCSESVPFDSGKRFWCNVSKLGNLRLCEPHHAAVVANGGADDLWLGLPHEQEPSLDPVQ